MKKKDLKTEIERLNSIIDINEAITELQDKMLNKELDLGNLRNNEIRLLRAKNKLLPDKEKTVTYDGLWKPILSDFDKI